MTTSKNKQTPTVERKEHSEKKEPYFKYTQELDSDLSIDNYKERKKKILKQNEEGTVRQRDIL